MSQPAVCILFFEKIEQTIECLESFLPSGVRIYLLNNGSCEAASTAIEAFCSRHAQIELLPSEQNLGVSGGRNLLLDSTTEDWLFFVDNDISMETTDWLVKIEKHIAEHPQTEVFIPRLYNVHEKCWQTYADLGVDATGKIILREAAHPVLNHFPGGASIIRRSMFERLGRYDDSIFVGGEDVELSFRGILSDKPPQALLIDDIDLRHDHRVAVNDDELKAASIRYDKDKIAHSYRRIKEKHGIYSDRGWRKWVGRQHRFIAGRRGVLRALLNVIFGTRRG